MYYFLTVAVFNALPFVGFGFLDNVIMIVAVSKCLKLTLLCSGPYLKGFSSGVASQQLGKKFFFSTSSRKKYVDILIQR